MIENLRFNIILCTFFVWMTEMKSKKKKKNYNLGGLKPSRCNFKLLHSISIKYSHELRSRTIPKSVAQDEIPLKATQNNFHIFILKLFYFFTF